MTIGQAINGGFPCLVNPMLAVQTAVASGNSFAVPAGTWQLTSWSVSSDATTGGIAAVIFDQTGAHSFKVAAISPTETPTPNAFNTFAWSTTVHGGQLLGFWNEGPNACINETGNPADTIESVTGLGKPSPGETEGTSPQAIDIIDISATLVPPSSASEPDVHHVYTCYSKFEQDGGEVDDAATAAMLVAAGRWYPTALAGNVDGGTNVGDYHLVCNPPATAQPIGLYVGIGGDVTSVAEAGSYAIAD